jgi:hypothetical protein
MIAKYSLGICELYLKGLHGPFHPELTDIIDKYLVGIIISSQEFFNDSYNEDIAFIQSNYDSYINNILINPSQFHWQNLNPMISNYMSVISRPNYIKLDIIEIKYLNSGECTACIKTFWLKILQKKWRKYLAERNKKIDFYKKPKNLLNRQLRGC